MHPTGRQRITIIASALAALFLGAMDALIVSAAMPTIVSDLGGMRLYSWVYSAYFLSRAVSLPIFGKLADLYKNKTLFMISIGLFIISSIGAGAAWNMPVLIAARVIQGLGAGGIFALVYIVLADVSAPEERAKTLSLGSVIWGAASVLGPTLGGVIVTFFSWRWIFFINIPIGVICLWGIGVHLTEVRTKNGTTSLDLAGATVLTASILALLFALMLGGREYPWDSAFILGLSVLFIASAFLFIWIEKRALDPILSIAFFRYRAFSSGNGAVFMSSFAIFSLFAFAPLFLQGVQGRTPMEVGWAMLSLSLGWSVGAWITGITVNRLGRKFSAVFGALCLLISCGLTTTFTSQTSFLFSFLVFFAVGWGMGFIALTTMLVVQSALGPQNLGVSTSANQFARTLGGAVGVGVCGSFIAGRFSGLADSVKASGRLDRLPAEFGESGAGRIDSLLQPDVQSMLPDTIKVMIQETVYSGVMDVFLVVLAASFVCLLFCLFIPGQGESDSSL